MKKLLVTLIAVAMLGAGTVAQAKIKKHRVVLTVGATAVEWTSPETYRRDEIVIVRVYYKGNLLDGREISKNCVQDYSGYGIMARIHSCDNGKKPSPLRIRVSSSRDDVVKVVFTYGPR